MAADAALDEKEMIALEKGFANYSEVAGISRIRPKIL